MQHKASKQIYALTLFLILITCYGYFMPKYSNWGSNSRVDLIFAIVDHGTFNIDAYHENTGDKAYFEGHYYSDKSIGPSLVALPFYIIYKGIAAIPPIRDFLSKPAEMMIPGTVPVFTRAELWGIRFFTFFSVAVPSALMGVVFFLLAARFAAKLEYAFLLSLICGLATVIFPFSNNLFQHILAAFGTFVGFYLLWRVIYEKASLSLLWLVGVSFSLAVITDYPAAILLGLIFLWALKEIPNRWALYRVVVGAVPLLLVMAAYHYAIFHNPLPVSYSYSLWGTAVHNQGFMGFVLPTWQSLYGVTFSSFRGIFLLSPILLLAFPGFYLMWRQSGLRVTVILLVTCVVIFIFASAAYLVWWGGYSVGPRFLVPLVPFLCLPIIFVFNQYLPSRSGKLVIGGLTIFSLLNVWLQTIAGFDFPPDVLVGPTSDISEPLWTLEQVNNNNYLGSPATEHSLPMLLRGHINANVGGLIHLSPLMSIVALLVIVGVIYFIVPRYLNRHHVWRG